MESVTVDSSKKETRIKRKAQNPSTRAPDSTSFSTPTNQNEKLNSTPPLTVKVTLEGIIAECEKYGKGSVVKGRYLTRSRKRNKREDHDETLERLCNVIDELKSLAAMVGLSNVKQCVAEHVLYLAQGLSSDEDMNHIQITGEPGVGKTTLAETLAMIYAGLGILETGEVVTATRSDFIGEHLGSTSIKTEEVLEASLGGVLLIDEVYSLGCSDKRDSFAKEAIDTINQFLSDHRNEFLCIIAGYENDINTCFFALNKGLERRFPWKYRMEKYTNEELKQVFLSQVKDGEWEVADDIDTKKELDVIFSSGNDRFFGSCGGDTATLFVRCKMARSVDLFARRDRQKQKRLDAVNLRRGFADFVRIKKNSSAIVEKEKYASMYV